MSDFYKIDASKTLWSDGWDVKVRTEGDTLTVSPAPWTTGDATVSTECGPLGQGYCDGYTQESEHCECYCHETNLSNVSGLNGMEVWHRLMWAEGIQEDDYED